MSATPPFKFVRWNPLILAVLLASVVLFLAFAIGPVWQIKDDVYYSMQSDGFGLVQAPVREVTYLGPIVTHLVGLVRTFSGFSYETFLFICIWLSTIPLLYIAQERGEGKNLRLTLVFLSALIVALFLQYTIISAWLAAVGLILAIQPASGHEKWFWRIFGLFFVGTAAAIRLEMALLAIFLVSVLLWVRADSEFSRRNILILAPLGLVLAIAVSHYGSLLSEGEFKQRNASIAPFVNYLYPSVIDLAAYEESGWSANDVALVTNWFFMDDGLLEPGRLAKFYAEAPRAELLRHRLAKLKVELLSLPHRLWPYAALGLLCTLVVLRRRLHSVLFITIFAGAYAAISLATKPPPDRVMLGLVLGLWISLLVFEKQTLTLLARRVQSVGMLLCFGAILRLFFLQSEAHGVVANDWRASFGDLRVKEPIYSFSGAVPIDALFRPFSRPDQVPEYVFFGSMALLDEVREEERARPDSGFIPGIVNGRPAWVIARDFYQTAILQRYFEEHHQIGVSYQLVAANKNAMLVIFQRTLP